jgi:hypothetical protein
VTGLFDGFEGYRVVSEAESREALTTALVAVDANVLLNLYQYNARTTGRPRVGSGDLDVEDRRQDLAGHQLALFA